jgi:hypothetical protein
MDDFTMATRLCDDDGMVSHEQIPGMNVGHEVTYLSLLNNWRARTARIRGDKSKPVTEPFHCTGSAHLIGEHIRCTSPAHDH